MALPLASRTFCFLAEHCSIQHISQTLDTISGQALFPAKKACSRLTRSHLSPLATSLVLFSEGFREICPAGPGYHYSASDLRYNTRPLSQDPLRVDFTQPRAPPATARPPAGELNPRCHFPGAARGP